ncbi:DUF3794 domain-containing protein [Tepidibacillus infernus]|uniref:SipL SPOCS domain-containing protein n=1 Tax=Tepidibacillus decaturensis TaxID=1413211 RepID=A0A135L296_9BACI|nr:MULTISPECIES: DUF3794 domain-containing protein [Tepidibacillus]KXG43086.1 hypothetical protein U473_02875 [Tepidibacillus decaturensis]GBF10024.1 hypothetical protein HK1_00036 [Tepidibacillus sp. HK-1]
MAQRDFVQIIGITDPSEFPVIGPLNPNNEIAIQERLTIPEAKPNVEQIISVLVEAIVTDNRTILTPTGVKVIVEGILRQKVVYTAGVPEQSVHSSHYEHPFCTFINIPLVIPAGSTVEQLLTSLGLSLKDILAGPVNVIIENVEVNLLDPRTINKCVTLFVWTTLNTLLQTVLK